MEQISLNEKIKNLLDQGIAASKDLAAKAESKTRELGEQGVMLFDIKQLEAGLRKLKNALGDEAYEALVERNESSIGRDNPAINAILAELSNIRETIERKKTELKNRQTGL